MLNFGGVTDEDLQIIIFRFHPKPLGREGILYMDHPEDQPLWNLTWIILKTSHFVSGLGFQGHDKSFGYTWRTIPLLSG